MKEFKEVVKQKQDLLNALQLMVNNFKEYQKESGAKNQAILRAKKLIKEALN